MADAKNSGHLIGRLGADPEYKITPAGVALATFRIAVNDAYGEKKTHWFNGVAWRQAADYLAEYCVTGNLIAITYHLKTDTFEDKKTGETRTTVKLEVDAVTNLTPRSDTEADEKPAKKARRDEEDEDEAPKKKKARRDDDDEDEKPAKKKKRADDDDEDEAPKKKRRAADEDDEDDEDEDERPKKKKKSSPEFEGV